ncbi:murein DD-endopeptidase MepM/ murein hydrolase activator NlpD [Altererythrobacter atlanticus]|uniref:Murein DD-endopeptidase MepM n=1 Tax=Croceibacterium atlanticum TaxID=1267766 RepID=A0A0F7KVX3_9SPHN|nr:M23 family metallopeptidase [Croceibacterium atlanticum]AKH43352.1 Murein DD-endopeptidase MepM [Croceibacterium atlanticum]MBB5731941.1 murein DD-endopeptidase MepM/ murein hydrolase activator NlpD [Croceibacterium atlanticum]
MFKDRTSDAVEQAGAHERSAQLSRAQILPDPAPSRIARVNSFAERYGEWRQQLSLKLARNDIAPDLAQQIGSARWLRGAATLIGLGGLALAAWPDFSPLTAAPAMYLDDDARDEFRSQMIMPLALGADSGRRMGATQAVVPLKSAPERPRLDLVATLSTGDSFERMLQRAGVGPAEAERVAGMVAGAMPLDEIKPGTQVDITLGRRPTADAPRPLDALSFRARFDLEIAVDRQDGRLALDPRPIKVDTTPLRIRGKVGSSLYRSARAAGAPARAVQQYLRAIGQGVDLNRSIASGDEFDLIVDYRRAATGEVEAGELLYAGLLRDGKPRAQLMRWGKDGEYYEASGVAEQRSGLIAPVPGRITSRYGMRKHPILGYKRMHRGLDFKATYGTPIYAANDGRVEFSGRNGGHGNYVRIGHGSGLATGYSHMSRIAVKNGTQVKRGQVIGYVGSTGLSTGPHLHYEMYRNGKTVDPSSVSFVTRAQLAGHELANFRAKLADLQTVEPGAALARIEPDAQLAERPQREIDRLDNRQKVG